MNLIWAIILIDIVCCVRIEENGYKGITVSLSERILEESIDLEKLKDVLKKSSEFLYHATRRRSYFEEFILVLPSTWSNASVCEGNSTEVPKNIDIYVTDTPDIRVLTAQHSKGCGEKGDIIYLPPKWLMGSTEDLALQFVRQWSIFRYGVFSENPERPGSCIATSDSAWSPTGCYNVDLDVEAQFDENGLPFCYFPEDFSKREDLRSSIMFSANSSKVLNFCDGSESLPHSPFSPTLHNRVCEGNTVWSVIKNTEDFRYGRNLPLKNDKPPNSPRFRCFKESKTHLTLTVQDTNSEARTEIRYSLLHFLSIIQPTEFSVSLVTFSNDTLTEEANPVELTLQDKGNLKSLLNFHVKLNEKVPNVCLTCGLRKAYEVSATSPYPFRIIILLARESSLENTETSELIKLVQSDFNVVLYLLFLEDTTNDIIPSSLVDAVQDSGGRIFRLKNDAVFMLSEINVALLDAAKNILHIEDKILVVHRKAYVNVKSDIMDVFLTPKKTKGKLLYSMQCKKRGDIQKVNDSCTDRDTNLPSPICGNESDLSGDEESAKVWRYPFQYIGDKSEGTTCSSLALMKLESSTTNPFTVKGWLNENKISPGSNALIIYAEIFGNMGQEIHVEARISGPALEEFRLELRDNGNGDPDVVKGDYIYSRYFTSFTQRGTYTVSIHAEALVAEKSSTKGNFDTNLRMITQTKVIGTFTITQSAPKEDILPPNRVSDLKVISIDNKNRTVLLQWTAPGDDYDYGKATKYTIKLSTHWMSLVDFTFNLKENILLETDDYKPANSGTTEIIMIQCPLSNYNATYYIALQTTDDKNNKGGTSNIIQIHFKDAYFPSNKSLATSTENIYDYNMTITSSVLRDTTTNYFTSYDTKITNEENFTVIPTNETKDGIFIEKSIFIIATSTSGTFILILIIINIIVCCCCLKKKHSENPPKISRKASLRPPYNLNIAYKHGSEASLEEENAISNSLSALVDPNSIYSSSDGSTQEKRYIYHTNRSLNKTDSQSRRNDLGFKLVQPMPAYATTSLSRFATRHRDVDDVTEISNTRSNDLQLQKFSNSSEDTHVYPLGQV